ncbi:hypothetical protein [Clostridium sp. VAP23]|uniref:hypothetical protein n=1 Tax=Clostridium sp. VAP23 TaxID=2949981 RepID=UPI002079D754|nr:hypothetical protein [Clostridium sp. VAP23]
MLYKDAYKYLVNIKGKSMTIEELNYIICQTEQFESPIDGYLLTDCIIQDKKYCSFNSYTYNNTVINIDISFEKIEDFNLIKEMSWNDINECNKIKIKVEKIYLYDI